MLKGKIYKLFTDDDDKIYIGATTSVLDHRLNVHRNFMLRHNSKAYRHFNNITNGDKSKLKCVLIEDVDCDDPFILAQREHYHIQQFKNELGEDKILNSRLLKENPLTIANIKNDASLKEYHRDYYHIKNKDKLLQKLHCEVCNKYVSKINFIRHQQSKKHSKKQLNNIMKEIYEDDENEN